MQRADHGADVMPLAPQESKKSKPEGWAAVTARILPPLFSDTPKREITTGSLYGSGTARMWHQAVAPEACGHSLLEGGTPGVINGINGRAVGKRKHWLVDGQLKMGSASKAARGNRGKTPGGGGRDPRVRESEFEASDRIFRFGFKHPLSAFTPPRRKREFLFLSLSLSLLARNFTQAKILRVKG